MKFLLLLGLFFVLVWLIRGARRGAQSGDASAKPSAGDPREAMVACAHCGLNLPQGEAVGADARWYCSDAHRDAHTGSSR
jgi:uncharacterized protein